MPALMKAADFIVCKAGGLIVTESLAGGLPVMLIDVTPGQEEGNADYILTNGAADLARSPLAALEILSHWLADDQALLKERAQAARTLGRPESAYTIADHIWAAAERGPLPIPESRKALVPKLLNLLSNFGLVKTGPAGVGSETTG
jgi:1,2-diacylglycerol 3-beta-galactosyltransferase